MTGKMRRKPNRQKPPTNNRQEDITMDGITKESERAKQRTCEVLTWVAMVLLKTALKYAKAISDRAD
jgi:hypothetical protein